VKPASEAGIDLTLLAPADLVDSRAHVVVDAPPWHAAQNPERMVMGIEQHLMRLQQIRLHLVLRALRRFRAPDERDIPQ
jgi:hypothetical protein